MILQFRDSNSRHLPFTAREVDTEKLKCKLLFGKGGQGKKRLLEAGE